ncbi:2,3-diaminopropionate biosynthesis protein SbnB [Kitasatospora sp. NPDC056181]|uniref:2,3-diaminopropionate biosynthesis protein SbnB n=1 Tax=Kitasatospora sp. NPDC056181 TaxID=3345737 RepID=UPI0035D6EAE9
MRILGRDDVRAALQGLDSAVLDSVRTAYVLHGQGQSDLPFSTFLRPLGRPDSRIIALPAYLGGPAPVMGLKWISSFPENLNRGMQRASSLCILNDLESGYPVALMEGSQISSVRTAASAALASGLLNGGRPVRTVGLIGCGTINHRVVSYLTQVHPDIETVFLQDAFPERAKVFAGELAAEYPGITFQAVDVARALSAETVSIATTDSSYWLDLADHPDRPHGQVILHLSLRDLSASSVLAAYNVVDDAQHAVREQTSLHRAEQQVGHREFVHAEIGAVLDGRTAPSDVARTVVFSPFGLGVLDLAVAEAVLTAATKAGLGTEVEGFDPGSHKVTSTLVGGTA